MHQFGDLATAGFVRVRARWRGEPPAGPDGGAGVGAGSPRPRPQRGRGRGHLVSNPHVSEGGNTTDAGSTTDAASTTDAGTITDDDGGSRPSGASREKKGPPASTSPTWSCRSGVCGPWTRSRVSVEPGHDRGAHRAQRVGQDHAPRHGVGARDAGGGIVGARRRGPRRLHPRGTGALGVVRSFQDCRLYPELTVQDTLMLCEDARHSVERARHHAAAPVGAPLPSATRPRPWTASSGRSASSASATTSRDTSRPAPAGWSTWRRSCWPARACCCSTSRRRASPSARPRRSSRCSDNSSR